MASGWMTDDKRRSSVPPLVCDFQSSHLFSTPLPPKKSCSARRLGAEVTDCLIRRQPVASLTCKKRRIWLERETGLEPRRPAWEGGLRERLLAEDVRIAGETYCAQALLSGWPEPR